MIKQPLQYLEVGHNFLLRNPYLFSIHGLSDTVQVEQQKQPKNRTINKVIKSYLIIKVVYLINADDTMSHETWVPSVLKELGFSHRMHGIFSSFDDVPLGFVSLMLPFTKYLATCTQQKLKNRAEDVVLQRAFRHLFQRNIYRRDLVVKGETLTFCAESLGVRDPLQTFLVQASSVVLVPR